MSPLMRSKSRSVLLAIQQYVRRDDFVRLEAAISSKLDSLAEKIDHLRERGNP